MGEWGICDFCRKSEKHWRKSASSVPAPGNYSYLCDVSGTFHNNYVKALTSFISHAHIACYIALLYHTVT